MKIKLIFFLLLGMITTTSAQQEEKGWDEGVAAVIEMTRLEPKEAKKIYVGNLPVIWKNEAEKNLVFYANDKKNIWVVVTAEVMAGETYQYDLTKSLKRELKKNKTYKALIYKGVTRIVNNKGEVIKKLKH